jgi:hypothetical protein
LVPPTRRLVIEYISGECFQSHLTSARISLGTTAGGSSSTHFLHLLSNALDSTILEVAQQTRIYADPGSSVGMGAGFSAGSTPASVECTLTLSGYTVSL